jgi:hypothetical protein
MPIINAFDVGGGVTIDQSEFDRFVVTLEKGLTSAEEKAAVAAARLKKAHDDLRDATKALNAEGGRTTENLERAAQAQHDLALSTAANARAQVALKESIGVTKKSADDLFGSFGKLGGITEHLGKLFGVGFAIESFIHLIEQTQESILELGHLSEQTGISIETLAGLRAAAQSAGISMEAFQQGLVKLERAQALAVEGGKQQIDAFRRIGISVTQLKTLTPEELFYRVATGIQQASSHADAAATAFQLFGRGGAQLIPILQQGGEELKKTVDRLAEASGVTKEAEQSAKQWQQTSAAVSQTLTASTIPVLDRLVPLFQSTATAISLVPLALNVLNSVFSSFVLAFGRGWEALGQIQEDVNRGQFRKAGADAKAAFGDISDIAKGAAHNVGEDWNKFGNQFSQIWKQAEVDSGHSNEEIIGEGEKALKEFIKQKDAEIDATKTVELAKQELVLATLRKGLDDGAITQQQYVAAASNFEELKYQIQAQALKNKIELHKQDPDDPEQVTKLNGELEALQIQHQAKILDDYKKNLDEFKKLGNEFANERSKAEASITIAPARNVLDAFRLLEAGLRSIGITAEVEIGHAAQEQQIAIAHISQAYDELIAHTNSAADAERLRGEKAKVLAQAETIAEQVRLEAIIATKQAIGEDANAEQAALDKINLALDKQNLFGSRVLKLWKDGGPSLQKTFKQIGDQGAQALDQLDHAMVQAVSSWILGQDSLGHAMRQATAQVLAELAARDAVYALEYSAFALADLAIGNFEGAAQYAEAAAIMGAIAVTAGVAARAINPKDKGSNAGAPETGGVAQIQQPAQNPVQVANAQHFAGGGLISGPTLAVIGDSIKSSSGRQREAAIPLDDPQAVEAIVEALGGGSGGDTHIHVRGLISPDNLTKVMRKMNRSVNKGQARLTANTSYKITRKA